MALLFRGVGSRVASHPCGLVGALMDRQRRVWMRMRLVVVGHRGHRLGDRVSGVGRMNMCRTAHITSFGVLAVGVLVVVGVVVCLLVALDMSGVVIAVAVVVMVVAVVVMIVAVVVMVYAIVVMVVMVMVIVVVMVIVAVVARPVAQDFDTRFRLCVGSAGLRIGVGSTGCGCCQCGERQREDAGVDKLHYLSCAEDGGGRGA